VRYKHPPGFTGSDRWVSLPQLGGALLDAPAAELTNHLIAGVVPAPPVEPQ